MNAIFSASDFEGFASRFKYPSTPVDSNNWRGPDPKTGVKVEQSQNLDQHPANVGGIRETLGDFVPPSPLTWSGSALQFPAYGETVTVDGGGALVGVPIQAFETCPS